MVGRAGRGAVVVMALAALLAGGSQADEIELNNGKTYKGVVLNRDSRYVMFKAVIGSGTAEMMFPVGTIKSVKVDGKMPQPEPAAAPVPRSLPERGRTPAANPQG